MRHQIMWILLGLHHGAAADPAVGPVAADSEAGIERADFPPALDLRILPRQPPAARVWPIEPGAIGAEGADRYSAAEQDAADEGLSFGLEVKRRPQLESRAWQDEDDAPGLQDDIDRLIERSTLGVRGSYRF
jgi:hypothetical protein